MEVRHEPPLRRVALFDMDKTLIRGNSAELFMRYRKRQGEVGLAKMLEVSFWLLQYSLGLLNAERAARKVLGDYKSTEEAKLRQACERWATNDVLPLISPSARRAVIQHQEAGDFVAIVTTSTRYGTEPLARELGITHVLCSELHVDEGLFTGKIVQPLCYGAGKVERTRRLLEEHRLSFDRSTFYTDSVTDLPLLEAVETPVAVNPDVRLKRIAKKNAWRIEHW